MVKKTILAFGLLILVSLMVISIGSASATIRRYLPLIIKQGEESPPGRETPTPEVTATSTPARDTPTPVATLTSTATEVPPTTTPTGIICDYVCITYINNDPTTSDDLDTEYVVIKNFTDEPVQMFDWLLSDSANFHYSFDLYTLGADESVKVWTKEGMDTQTDLFWSLLWPAWDQYTDCGLLQDQYNQPVDEYCY